MRETRRGKWGFQGREQHGALEEVGVFAESFSERWKDSRCAERRGVERGAA